MFSPALQCGAAMLNSLLRSLSVVSRELKRLRKCEEQDGEKILELEEKLEVNQRERQRERERETERQRDRDRERQRETDKERSLNYAFVIFLV